MTHLFATLVLAPLALVVVALPAAAAPNDLDAKSVQVSYAGLDLTKPAGQAELDRRIARGVSTVCDSSLTSPLAMRGEIRKCRAYALANAKARRQAVVAAAIQDRATQVASR